MWGTIVGVMVMILYGSYIVGAGYGSSCGSWPLCQGWGIPRGIAFEAHMGHRYLAVIIFALVAGMGHVAWRRGAVDGELRWLTVLTGGFLVAEILVGAFHGVAGVHGGDEVAPPDGRDADVGVGGAAGGGVSPSRPVPSAELARGERGLMIAQSIPSPGIVRDYIALTKPRIISLLLVTAVGGMVLAAKGLPDPIIALFVIVCGYLAAGGAHALNHYIESDIDSMMHRTRKRPVASGRVSRRQALVFGIVLTIASFALLSAFVNVLSAALTLSGTLIYIFVYTIGLKRSTPQNIVIGGAAGAVPPMVGWAAVTGTVGLPAVYLFAIIFFWTPPHFWALALLIKDDYARAGVPMLPVVTSVDDTKQHILLYTVLLVALTLMFFTTGAVGWVYLVSALGLGGAFIYLAIMHIRSEGTEGTKSLYLYSLLYLALLFLAVMIDGMVNV